MTIIERTTIIVDETKYCWLCGEPIERSDSAVQTVERISPNLSLTSYHHPRCEDRA